MEKGERITDAGQVSGLLRRILEHRALLTVTLPNTAGAFNSAILDLDPDQRYLLLDELNPAGGHKKLLQHRELRARATVMGVEIRFRTALQEVGSESGIPFYRVDFPDEVRYLQKRSSFRIRVGMGSKISVELRKEPAETFAGRIVDMSETGVGVYVDAHAGLSPGDLLPCQLALPGKVCISCKLDVRYVKQLPEGDKVHFGGHFVELPPNQHKKLARAIADLQREMIRKLPRDQI